jgi:hypothetical protein
MDYVYFGLFVIIVILLAAAIFKSSAKAKEKYKQDAYRLLDLSDPNPKELENTMKNLHRYTGHSDRDQEAKQLIKRLIERLDQLAEVNSPSRK